MLPQGTARSEIRQPNRLPVVSDRRCLAGRAQIDLAIGQSFNPETLWIGNLEQDVLRLNDLPRHDLGGSDDAIGWSAQLFVSGAGIARGFAPRAQALQLAFEVVDLALWYRASFRQRSQPSQLVFCDRYQLFDLADLFQDGRAIRDRQIRFDLDENVALADPLPDAGYGALARNDPAAIDALHNAAAVWIGNDAADQVEGGADGLRLGCGRADVQQALGRLGGKGGAVLQASRRVAQSLHCRRACVGRAVSIFAEGVRGKHSQCCRDDCRGCCGNGVAAPS